MGFFDSLRILLILLILLACTASCVAQTPAAQTSPGIEAAEPGSTAQPTGSVSGTAIDPTGAVIAGAQISLSMQGRVIQQVKSGDKGQFLFAGVPAGAFQIKIEATGFSPQTFSGTLAPGENQKLLPIMLSVGQAVTSVDVGVPQVEVAQEEVRIEEKQRVLGVVPNFYVSYIPDAAPLDARQKFQLAFRTVIDPFTLLVVAGAAGVQQAQGHFQAYGTGPQGYAKRFGANFGDTVTGTFFGDAVFPWIFKQDPRYFYKGTGSMGSRMYYAISRAVITKGDNKRWQPNYSAVLGDLAAGGVSNLYYPANDRNGAGLTFANAALGLASGAVTNVLQEFVVPRFMPKHKNGQTQSQSQNPSGEY